MPLALMVSPNWLRYTGNQACAFDCDIVCAVSAAALVGGEVHVDRFLAGNVDFGADNDFFTAFVYDRVVFDVDLGVFEFQHGAGVGADQQGLELFSQRLFLCVSCSTPWGCRRPKLSCVGSRSKGWRRLQLFGVQCWHRRC